MSVLMSGSDWRGMVGDFSQKIHIANRYRKHFIEALSGEFLLRKLLRIHGPLNVLVIVRFHSGEAYLSLALHEEIHRQYGKKPHYFLKDELKDLPLLFGNGAVDYTVIDRKTMRCLTKIVEPHGRDNVLVVLPPTDTEYGIPEYFTIDEFMKVTLRLRKNATYARPSCEEYRDRAQAIMASKNLKNGRTVVLSPYAQSIKEFSLDFWRVLYRRVESEGYTPVFNRGVGAGFLALDEVPRTTLYKFVELAGFFVGLRSGLCDVLGETAAKKVILYPKEMWDPFLGRSVLERFGLMKQQWGRNIVDYEFDDPTDREVEIVLREIKSGTMASGQFSTGEG